MRKEVPVIELIPKRYTLSKNGSLSVLSTSAFKSGLLNVCFFLPITEETACLAPLMLSVLRRGTERYPTLAAINLRLDELYGTSLGIQSSYRGDRLLLGIGAELLGEEYLPEPVDLLAGAGEIIGQILLHPLLDADGCFRAEAVEREKELQCETIRSAKNNPRSYASKRAASIFHQNEPVGIPLYGTEEQVMAVTPQKLTDFWKSFLSGACPFCLSVGSLPAERIRAVLEKNLPFSDASLLPFYAAEPPMTAGEIRRVEETMEISQGHLRLCYRTGTCCGKPDHYAASIMSELLGGASNSRLFVNVREKSSLCYSIGASDDPARGTMVIRCGLHPDNRAIAEEKILSEIEEIRAGSFTDEELETAKKALLNASRQQRDSVYSLEGFYRNRIHRGSSETIADQQAAIASVTREEVIHAARALSLDTVYFLRGTKKEIVLSDELPDDEV